MNDLDQILNSTGDVCPTFINRSVLCCYNSSLFPTLFINRSICIIFNHFHLEQIFFFVQHSLPFFAVTRSLLLPVPARVRQNYVVDTRTPNIQLLQTYIRIKVKTSLFYLIQYQNQSKVPHFLHRELLVWHLLT